MSTIRSRLTSNFAANLMAQITGVLFQLGSVPLFLKYWSTISYGEWILISSIPTYLSLAEAGFGTQSANQVSMYVVQNEIQKARMALHTAWGFLSAISIVAVLLVGSVTYFVPWSKWLNLPTLTSGRAGTVVLVLSVYAVLSFSYSILSGVYRAVYRNSRIGFIQSFGRLAELGVIWAVVRSSNSMLTLSWALLAVRIIFVVGTWVDCLVLSPELRLGYGSFSFSELGKTWRPSVMFMAFGAANAIYFQGLTLIVGIYIGPVAVVTYNSTRALTRAIPQFINLVKHSVWPEFSYFIGSGNYEGARKLNAVAFELSWLGSIALSLILFLFAPFIMAHWTHRTVAVDKLLFGIFLLSAILNASWFVTSGLLMGINKHEGLATCCLVSTVVACGIGLILVRFWGIYGIALAMVICELLVLPYALGKTCKVLKQPVGAFLADAVTFKTLRAYTLRALRSTRLVAS